MEAELDSDGGSGGYSDDDGGGSQPLPSEAYDGVDEAGNPSPRRGAALASSTAGGSTTLMPPTPGDEFVDMLETAFADLELEATAAYDAADEAGARRWLEAAEVSAPANNAGESSPLSSHNLRRHLGHVGRMSPTERLERWRAADAV